VTREEGEGGEAVGFQSWRHAYTRAREAKMEQVIEAVSMSAPIFVAAVRAPGLRMFHAIDDTWRLQD
jgi:hypothetical protein